jgi:hypothetical protein
LAGRGVEITRSAGELHVRVAGEVGLEETPRLIELVETSAPEVVSTGSTTREAGLDQS